MLAFLADALLSTLLRLLTICCVVGIGIALLECLLGGRPLPLWPDDDEDWTP